MPGGDARELSLLKAIWTFIGLPPLPPRATASDYLQALRKLTPAIGQRGVIIDDSHGIGERQNEHSGSSRTSSRASSPACPRPSC